MRSAQIQKVQAEQTRGFSLKGKFLGAMQSRDGSQTREIATDRFTLRLPCKPRQQPDDFKDTPLGNLSEMLRGRVNIITATFAKRLAGAATVQSVLNTIQQQVITCTANRQRFEILPTEALSIVQPGDKVKIEFKNEPGAEPAAVGRSGKHA